MRATKSATGSSPPKASVADWPRILEEAVTKPGLVSAAYSRFWNYSFGNGLLALFQCMARGIEPGPIHTYAGWARLGRHVRKGERAIVLVMPVSRKRKRQQDLPANAVEPPEASDGCAARELPYTAFVERPFWFVLSQTQGADVPPEPVRDWDEERALAALQVSRVRFTHSNGNCQGYAIARRVAVSPVAFHPHRTLFHELAHVVLGHTEELRDPFVDGAERTPRDLREAEAECVALLCMASLGLPGEEFSRGYLQHWIGHRPVPPRNALRVFRAADAILRAGREPGPGDPQP